MAIKSQKDFFSGLMFVSLGLAFAIGSRSYNLGDGARMGPGYFPFLLGIVLGLIGLVVLFKSLVYETADGDKVGRWAWRPLSLVIAANLVFGVLLGGLPSIGLRPLGLVVAIFALTIIASLADGKFHLRSVLTLASVLALGSYLTFIVLLKLNLSVWPTFISG